ncbi:MAG: hypothetical protein ACR2LL_13665, partial [Nitrosopumilus sp.]
MAKNERIIAQDLAEIKHALQIHDASKITELCGILTKEIKKYPVKPDIFDRLDRVSRYSDNSLFVNSNEDKVKEVDELINILI